MNDDSRSTSADSDPSTDRGALASEQRLAVSTGLDRMPIDEVLRLMSEQDAVAVRAVAARRGEIARAAELTADALKRNGRLIYVGAGTSGRLAALEAYECPVTFGTPPGAVRAIVANDEDVEVAATGAEDDADAGAAAVEGENAGGHDFIIGIAAGGTTPFVLGALRRARARGARTAFMTCVDAADVSVPVDVLIALPTGPEVLTGSTRLKAGTACKLAMNQITTAAMVRLGKVYDNLMVDLVATNAKLWDRGARILMALTPLPRPRAQELLQAAEGNVKVAAVMAMRGLPPEAARRRLAAAEGSLRAALEEEPPEAGA